MAFGRVLRRTDRSVASVGHLRSRGLGTLANGTFSRVAGKFNECTTPKPLPPNWEAQAWPGTIFLIAASLREPSHLFKLLCDVSGRLESASRRNIKRFMSAGAGARLV